LSIEESLEDVITQRPLATVGLALGIGFLIGPDWRNLAQVTLGGGRAFSVGFILRDARNSALLQR